MTFAPSCAIRPPLPYYLDLLPPLRQRYFSLASSPAAHPEAAHITVAVVRYRRAQKCEQMSREE